MSSLFRAAPDHPSVPPDSTGSLAPTDQGGAGPSLAQALEPDRPIPDVAMERAREDLAETEYLNLIRWAVRKAPELLRVLRIAYLFGQDSSSPEDKAAGAGYRLFRRAPRAPAPYLHSSSEKLEDIEREHISRVLKESPSVVEAARRLGINYSTLWRKRKRYKLL
ncbi:MAG TPA: helix-turn-helix domain-containing protein [Candidatus Binataceae bacterium]